MRRAVLCFALAAAGCASVQVTTQVEPDTDVSRFATFFQTPPPPEHPKLPHYTDELAARIQAEIAQTLDAKGYRAAAADDADLRVAFRVSGDPRTRVLPASDPDTNYDEVERYTEGVLVIDVIETDTGRRVWKGRGQTPLFTTGQLIRTDVERAALQTVKAILAAFPTRAQAAAGSGS